MSHESQDDESLNRLTASMAAASVNAPADGNGASDSSSGSSARLTQVGDDANIVGKGPKRPDQGSKSDNRLRQPQQQQQQQQQVKRSSLVSPVTPIEWPPAQPPPQPQPQPQSASPEEFDANFDFLNELIASNSVGYGVNQAAGCPVPSGTSEIVISMPMAPPQPLPPIPTPTATTATVNSAAGATAAAGRPTVKQHGPPVSEATRLALIGKLRPQSTMVDENFSTPLHEAVLHGQSKEFVDILLIDLRNKRKLMPMINLVNSHGHTPLSLCLKLRRSDLIPSLLSYDAAPTQLCGSAFERSNHFHYAMCKCLDSAQSLQVVSVFINSVCRHCVMDLPGLLAKNRQHKTPMDFLGYRISLLSQPGIQLDPVSAELLSMLQSLNNWLCKQLGVSF